MKRVLVFLVVMLIIPGLVLLSGDNTQKKAKVIKGAEVIKVKGHTRHWKDADKTPLDKRTGPRKMRPVMNFGNPRQIVKQTDDDDPVAQTAGNKALSRGAKAMPTPIIHFAGMNLSANGDGWPPDTCGDVGNTYFVQAVNTSIGIYNKSTGALVSATTFNNFFEGSAVSGTPCDEDNFGDPIVLYDQYAQRWIIFDFAWYSNYSGGSWYSIAASKTSDPTGEWWLYALNADPNLMNDYPKGGVWHDGIYITANMFQFTGSFQHAKIWALDKTDLYNGTLTAQTITDSSYEAWSILPSHAKGTTAPSAGTPNYMYALDADEYGGQAQDAIYWWKLTVDWNNSSNTTWAGPYTMLTASFGLTGSGIPQPGTTWTLDSLYGRLMNPAIYRNFGSYEAVYLNHVCEYSGTRKTRWYEIRINSGTSSIYQQGTYAPDTHHRWMGSIAADKYGNIALGYSVASGTLYPSIRYAGRLSSDPLNQLSQGEASMIEGTGSQTQISRWGDYSCMSIDPTDDETFWYTQEYYITTGTNWQTRIGSFKYTAPSPPDAPSNLTANAAACNQIDLGWQDNSNNEDGFKIERSLNGTTFSQIDTVGANVTTYSDTTVAETTTYWYRVKAYNSVGDSGYSNTASDTTPQCPEPPAAPTNLSANAPLCDRIDLNWTDNANNEDGFKVERSLNGTTFSQIDTVGANVTSYSDTTVAQSTTYWYRVRAYNTAGDSAYSNIASAATPQCPGDPPAAPTIRKVRAGRTYVAIRWTDNADDETGYKVYRGLSSGNYTFVKTLPANTTRYTDPGLARRTTYYYKVCAYNTYGEGCSSEFSATTR